MKQNIGSLFDRIAGHYDRLNHLLSLNADRRWRRVAVRGMQPAEQVLDVAIGTADLTIELLRSNKAQHITGIDLSPAMMAIGKKKVNENRNENGNENGGSDHTGKNGNVVFMQANALEMPFADGTFDAVTSSYGVRNFSDLDQGLREMYRVLRSGGELMILELSYPTNRLIAWGYDVYFSHILPWIGRIISHDKTAYTYLNKSVKHFIWGEEMCEHIRAVGFQNVRHQALTFGISTIYRAVK
ncbi:MAG: bifunctional demethylmenaquinone methyltransferase/2-methoxy-6-polyprenyl-1,4-benzoquinol methylase UbiE [Bacteroidales bacterium]|nr:bifunctional demethylmenaquinone methyltransferase/2-methoxy-6-polyprenyl-1,4-benzoquinol methylase UbiE [Bacteroidales bacterium]